MRVDKHARTYFRKLWFSMINSCTVQLLQSLGCSAAPGMPRSKNLHFLMKDHALLRIIGLSRAMELLKSFAPAMLLVRPKAVQKSPENGFVKDGDDDALAHPKLGQLFAATMKVSNLHLIAKKGS